MTPKSRSLADLETHDDVSALGEQFGTRRVALGGLISGGRHFYREAIAPATDDTDALARVEQVIRPAFALRPDRPWIPEELDDIDRADIANAMWCGKWCASGFPRVRLRTQRAALFAATAIPGGATAEVRPPWPAFIIQLDGEPQLLRDSERPNVYFDQIEVLYSTATGHPSWTFFRRAPSGENYFRLWSTPEEWGSQLDAVRLFDREESDAQTRMFQVLSRIVLGMCIHMTNPQIRENARNRGRSKRFRRSGPPQMTDFVIGNDVTVDVAEAITHYVRGGGGSPTVQCLVRGHWKHQAHGPRLSLRKWIHVEPYWRGPEDGPVVIRPHVLGNPREGKAHF